MEGLHSLSFCVSLCVCVSVYACSHGAHVYRHARGGQRSTLSVFFILLLNVELTDLFGWLVSFRNPPASTVRLQAYTTMAGFPNECWRSNLCLHVFPGTHFLSIKSPWLMEHYLYHPDSVAHVAHVDHKIATLRLP